MKDVRHPAGPHTLDTVLQLSRWTALKRELLQNADVVLFSPKLLKVSYLRNFATLDADQHRARRPFPILKPLPRMAPTIGCKYV